MTDECVVDLSLSEKGDVLCLARVFHSMLLRWIHHRSLVVINNTTQPKRFVVFFPSALYLQASRVQATCMICSCVCVCTKPIYIYMHIYTYYVGLILQILLLCLCEQTLCFGGIIVVTRKLKGYCSAVSAVQQYKRKRKNILYLFILYLFILCTHQTKEKNHIVFVYFIFMYTTHTATHNDCRAVLPIEFNN